LLLIDYGVELKDSKAILVPDLSSRPACDRDGKKVAKVRRKYKTWLPTEDIESGQPIQMSASQSSPEKPCFQIK
jgi:hypothetical protein